MTANVPKILLVEDDPNLGFLVKEQLEESGFDPTWCQDGQTPIDILQKKSFDLILLDIMLPKNDGFEIAKWIRERNAVVPIIFLTARENQEDVLKGFEIGGDDYIMKPFTMKELIYRIKVFLKRTAITSIKEDQKTNQWKIGQFLFDYENHSLILEGRSTEKNQDKQSLLTVRESDVLKYLVENQSETVKRNELLNAIWGSDDYFMGRSLDVFISRLRKRLVLDPNISINNVHGIGFKLIVKN